MPLSTIILYLSMIAWIFPIFRQFRCNIFYFFLLLGISDPLAGLFMKITSLSPVIIAVIISPFLFYSINIDRKKKFSLSAIEIFVFALTLILMFTISNLDIVMLIIHTLILIRVIFKILIELHHKQIVNIFHLVLAFYMTTSVASLIIYLNGDHQAIILFYINLAFQILIAIFFATFREDHPKLTYSVIPAFKD
jgi:hypothetical protein